MSWGGGYGQQGFGQQQGFGFQQQGFGFQQPGFQQPGFQQQNNWGGMQMQQVNYQGGWNANVHDQMLMAQVEQAYMKYDMNRTGQLEGQEFYLAYRDLCLGMGMYPPNDFNQIQMIAQQSDTNFDGRTSKQEMFALFKRIQFQQMGWQY